MGGLLGGELYRPHPDRVDSSFWLAVNGVNTSFSEMMALPNTQLDTTYWLPWYNNVDLDTQLRFGVP
jgi:hypothetical protein